MRTNLSQCLGLIDNGQHKSTNRLLVLVPHDRPHGVMRIPENQCMLLPKAQKMRAIKQTMALITDSIGCTECAPAQMPWHLRHLNPALLNRQGMCTYPKMENGSELWTAMTKKSDRAFLFWCHIKFRMESRVSCSRSAYRARLWALKHEMPLIPKSTPGAQSAPPQL